LQAFDLGSGKMVWEVGGCGEKNNPLSDSYFLGPPLPLRGLLYLLTQKGKDLRLVCLQTSLDKRPERREVLKVKGVSIRPLAQTTRTLEEDPLRRTQAAHLAYHDGILVVATNAGAIFGVNLQENSLAWAFPYHEKEDAAAVVPPMRIRGRGGLPPGWVCRGRRGACGGR
jgi:hypothetical protein